MDQFSSFKKNIDSLLAAIAGFVIIFLFTRHGGIGICPDGVVYCTTAQNLHSNGTLTDFTHYPVVDFPAFYPIFLSAVMWFTGSEPLVFAPILNALLFAATIYLSGYIMQHFFYRSTWYKRAILCCIVLSPCLLEVYSMVWSETLFILLLLLFIIAMNNYFKTYSRKILITAAVIAAVAAVTRYAGITIIATGGILILLDTKLAIKRKITHLLLYTVLSPSLLIINLVRNFTSHGTITGNRETSFTPLAKNLHDAGSVFYDWLPFLTGHYSGAAWFVIFLIVCLSIICIKYFLRNKGLATYESIAAIYSLFYILFMVITASISRFEQLNSRFFSPVFIFIVWSCSNWIIALQQKVKFKKWIIALGVLLFLGFMYGELSVDYETWDGVKDAGIPGYTEDQWKYSETVKFIENDSLPFKKGYTIYSNAYDAVYFFTHRPGKFLPGREYTSGIQQFLKDPHCYMIWFSDGDNPDLVDMAFITNVKKMKLLKQFSDGAIYEYDE